MADPPHDSDPLRGSRPSPEVIREFNDRGTLWLLEDPLNVRDLLALVDPRAVSRLDFSRAERVNRSFIPEDLRKQESDLVLRVPAGPDEGSVWVYVLVEHQSAPEEEIALRLLLYMGNLWSGERRAWADREAAATERRLTGVIPMVFYTGERDWQRLPALCDLMDLPPELQRFVPAWETLFLNLRSTPPEALEQAASTVGWALRVLQADRVPQPELETVLRDAMQALNRLEERSAGQWLRAAWYVGMLVFHRRGADEHRSLWGVVAEQAKRSRHRLREEVLQMGESMAQLLERKGQERGEARGEARGKRAALEVVLRARFGPLSSEVLTILEGADTEALDRWLEKAAVAHDLSEVGIPSH